MAPSLVSSASGYCSKNTSCRVLRGCSRDHCSTSATLDVLFGRFAPVGKLPLTLPKGDEVLAVNADGVCISPNDVPGYAKDAYMPDCMKDENGKAYAYRDAAGNYYELNFGLSY